MARMHTGAVVNIDLFLFLARDPLQYLLSDSIRSTLMAICSYFQLSFALLL